TTSMNNVISLMLTDNCPGEYPHRTLEIADLKLVKECTIEISESWFVVFGWKEQKNTGTLLCR
ncbi:MAG: hypothetical protein KDE58_23225, partial [Caldilineaceae bacterium]|nr:hypothetical protein [Caldilineaceae bacterium]